MRTRFSGPFAIADAPHRRPDTQVRLTC